MIFVAVCARSDASIEACVAALRAAGVSEPAFFRADPGHGLAQARNAALAACDREFLAFVEDDVAVDPGWLEALREAWETSAEDVAVIGGPLRPAIVGGKRPRWLSDVLLGSFGVQDEHADSFHGGNVSFRAAALRAVGGFWPARGEEGVSDWFGEEHEAQRELARGGWGRAFAPAAAATRLVAADVTPRAVLRRRARYGARLELIGEGRSRATAVRTLLSSAAGALLALARGNRAVAMERRARVAENAGVLLARRLAHDGLQPVARETPFRASVPPPQPRHAARPGRPSGGPQILLYHRVAEVDSDPLGLCVTPANFAAQLDAIAREVVVVPLAAIAAGEAGPHAVAITFDDGYVDNLLNVAPALAARELPATLFAATGHIATGAGFWWDAVDRLLRAAPPSAAPVFELEGRAFRVGTPDQRARARADIHAFLQPRDPDAVAAFVAALGDWAGTAADAPPERDRPLTIDELRAFAAAAPGLTVGAHTRRHLSLRHAETDTQEQEVAGSRDDVAAWLGEAPEAFSYPFGVLGADVDEAVAARVRAAGFAHAVVNDAGRIAPATDRFLLPRRAVPDIGGEEFARWLKG